MSKQEQFFTDKSNLTSAISDFIKLCQEVEREWQDELDDVCYEAEQDAGVKRD